MKLLIIFLTFFVLTFTIVHAELTKQDVEEVRSIVREEIDRLEKVLNRRIDDLRAELKDDIASLRSELKDDIASLDSSFSKKIDGLDKRIDSLEESIRSLTGYLIGGIIAIVAAIIGQGIVIGRREAKAPPEERINVLERKISEIEAMLKQSS